MDHDWFRSSVCLPVHAFHAVWSSMRRIDFVFDVAQRQRFYIVATRRERRVLLRLGIASIPLGSLYPMCYRVSNFKMAIVRRFGRRDHFGRRLLKLGLCCSIRALYPSVEMLQRGGCESVYDYSGTASRSVRFYVLHHRLHSFLGNVETHFDTKF